MEESQGNNNLVMDVLYRAFPNRSEEQLIAFALLYTGMRWGKDCRFGEVPNDETGLPMKTCRTNEAYWQYVHWLADYLHTFREEPNHEQYGLCRYVERMIPEDAVQLIAMNAAFYQEYTEPIESWIEEGRPFAEYSEDMRHIVDDADEYDEEAEQELYEQVRREMAEDRQYCHGVSHADVAYRIPLSIALQKEPSRNNRVRLVDRFFMIYDEYLLK